MIHDSGNLVQKKQKPSMPHKEKTYREREKKKREEEEEKDDEEEK